MLHTSLLTYRYTHAHTHAYTTQVKNKRTMCLKKPLVLSSRKRVTPEGKFRGNR